MEDGMIPVRFGDFLKITAFGLAVGAAAGAAFGILWTAIPNDPVPLPNHRPGYELCVWADGSWTKWVTTRTVVMDYYPSRWTCETYRSE